MAAMRKGMGYVEGAPKKSRQGTGKHTKYAATSRNGARKRYRGQGRGWIDRTVIIFYVLFDC